MGQESRVDALILPGDDVPSVAALKRQLLFFSSLTLVDPADAALVNEGEVKEQFPGMLIGWAPRNSFPRVVDYEEKFRALIADTRLLQQRQLLRLAERQIHPVVDPGMNVPVFHAAACDEDLVLAAAPDRTLDAKPKFEQLGSYMYGLLLTQGGYQSKYAIKIDKPRFEIPGHDQSWTVLAHLRLGRSIKFLRRAYGENRCPVALDSINAGMVAALDRSISKSENGAEASPALAFALDVIDPVSLEQALDAMSWVDVIHLRKQILPSVSTLRELLVARVTGLRLKHRPDTDLYREELQRLHSDFASARDQLSEKWEKLRIGAVAKSGQAAAAIGGLEAIGMTLLNPALSWINLTLAIVALGLGATGALAPELKELIPARRKVREHPLFFLERLPKMGKSSS